jgi:hypothetical protein
MLFELIVCGAVCVFWAGWLDFVTLPDDVRRALTHVGEGARLLLLAAYIICLWLGGLAATWVWPLLRRAGAWAASHLPARALIAGLDAYAALQTAFRWARMEAEAIFTVRCDPWKISKWDLPLAGCPDYTSFIVEGTAGEHDRRAVVLGPFGETPADEYNRRAVAWFYRWHDAPTDADWQQCLARFGIAEVPAPFALWLRGPAGEARLTVEEIVFGAEGRRGSRKLTLSRQLAEMEAETRTIAGETPIGGHAMRSYVRAFVARRKAL